MISSGWLVGKKYVIIGVADLAKEAVTIRGKANPDGNIPVDRLPFARILGASNY